MMNRKGLLVVLLLLVLLLLFFLWCRPEGRRAIVLRTASGLETSEFEIHDSMLLETARLEPHTGYEVRIATAEGEVVSRSMLSTDSAGIIPATVVWYDIGVRPCVGVKSARVMTERADPEVAGRAFRIEILRGEELIRTGEFRVTAERTRPKLYATDARGCARSGFLIGEEDVWVVGENFPAGSLVRLWVVEAGGEWDGDMELHDLTKQYGSALTPLIEMGPDQTGFFRPLWPRGLTSIGSYDIVAEVVSYPFGDYRLAPEASALNVVADLTYSGFVVQRRLSAGEPAEQDAAGVRMSQLAYRDTFLTSENVYVGVDPYVHTGYIGKTANVYIVADKTDAQWTTDNSLTDVTGFVEQVTIQPGACANCYSVLAWAAPLTPGHYDVVLDFNTDGVYTSGTDLIDSLDPVGFTVSELRVDSISFRYSGSSAFPIYDNLTQVVISPPEYSVAGIRPAAWAQGGSHSVKVAFRADPGISSAEIWAETGLGGLASTGSPVTVTISGGAGQATFPVNSPPSAVGKAKFDWEWKYKNLNGAPSATSAMGFTNDHVLYTTVGTPQAPMATPWLEVLDYATTWASGETDIDGVRTEIVSGIYNSGMVYSGALHHTTGMGNFDLTSLLNELRAIATGPTIYMDCRDCANFFHVLTNSLGANDEYLRIPGLFYYQNLLPMGQSLCKSGTWNFHQVGWCSNNVADPSGKVSCPSSTAVHCNLSATDYINVASTGGVSAGATGICSPF